MRLLAKITACGITALILLLLSFLIVKIAEVPALLFLFYFVLSLLLLEVGEKKREKELMETVERKEKE